MPLAAYLHVVRLLAVQVAWQGMQTTEKRLKEFQSLYEQEFGEKLSDEEARAMIHRLMALYQIILRPLPSTLPSAPNPRTASAES